MSLSNRSTCGLSRRNFMKITAATAITATLPFPTARSAAMFRRKNLQGKYAGKDLVSYKKAVKAMLALPPDDPRNWHRIAFTHLLDCPHGNWWFLVWHRGYLGWFERTCRELSGDPDFALPYWDWTKEPTVPMEFWDDVLNPDNMPDVVNLSHFRSKYKEPMENYWKSFSPEQIQQQMIRGSMSGYTTFNEFWTVVEDAFFEKGGTRVRTEEDPNFPGWAKAAVQESVIEDSLLAPQQFISGGGAQGFESSMAMNHHIWCGSQSLLEGQPHNLVHGAIGGFMGRFLSPTDPIFFLHHCNIDRLWDVWNRKQLEVGDPISPPGNAADAYRSEPFLFFSDEKKSPASKIQAGDYFDIGDFNYDYEPGGTGDGAVTERLITSTTLTATPSVQATLRPPENFGIGRTAKVTVELRETVFDTTAVVTGVRHFARINITPPPHSADIVYDVFIGPKDQAVKLDLSGPNYAGSFTFFGRVHHAHLPTTFTIGLTDTVNQLRDGQPVDVTVVAESSVRKEDVAAMPSNAQLNSVMLGTF